MHGQEDFVLAALLQERLVKREQVDAARAQAAARDVLPTQALSDMRIVDTRVIAMIRAGVCECPFVDPAGFDINLSNTHKLSRAAAETLRAFPLFILGDVATVGMADPLDLRAVDQLRTLLKCEIEPVLVEPEGLRNLIDRAYALTAGPRDAAPTIQQATTAELESLTTGKEPIVAAVNQIIAQGIDLGASDIHIGPDEYDLHLRYRVDGTLQSLKGPSIDVHKGLVQRLKVMANLDLTVSRKPQDGKIRFTHNGRSVDIRLSLIPTVAGENVVMRLLASSGAIRGLEELGFPAEETAYFESAIEQPHGMILVTGPTGSGKTTTLYTALKRLNTAERNIMTIEDPVEVRMPLIRQVQVSNESGMTFASSLRSILRQDPDVIFVGEIRDEETARISVQAALTGHLVLSSLHTNDAAGALPRLRDLGVPSFAVNAALLNVIAQRLAKRVCEDCARPHCPDAAILERFGLEPGTAGFVMGAGCTRCGSTGTHGRIGVYEVLRVSPGVRRLVDKLASATEIRHFAVNEGFKELWRDGVAKAQAGQTTLEEIARIVAVQATETDEAKPSALRAAA